MWEREFSWYMEIALPTGDTRRFSHRVPDAEFVLVHNLVSIGLFCRDTTFGQPPFSSGDDIQLTISQVFVFLNLNGAWPFLLGARLRGRRLTSLSLRPDRCLERRTAYNYFFRSRADIIFTLDTRSDSQ
jgi:hypothetical protein